ncbi:MAG: hypothetical protein CMJ94_04490 [Planctomycetes bacterium]|nr:hypothetical protein [Planctomycetota bacterium]
MLRGMLGVLRRNPRYRLLWAAQAISMTGDWLNRVAILALLSSLGGVEEAGRVGLLFGVELFVRMMPTVFLGGLAGAVADRLSRRALMIGSDLIRAGGVLGYLLVDEPSEIPLLYLLLILQMGLGIFFQAARSAAIPATVDPADLGRAYELAAVTWSVILCVGALLGGLLAEVIGINGVFLCDAATYLVSASLLARLHLPAHEKAAEPFRWKEVLLFQDLARGVRHARERGVVWAILAKTFWGPAGGYLVLLPILASRHVEVEGDAAALAWYTSLYYAARGIGTGLGPVLVRRIWGTSDRTYRTQIAGGFGVAAVAYAILPSLPGLAGSLACVVVAHMGGSAIWVGSTTLWQTHVRESYRGRIFSAEFAGMTASFALAGLLAGLAYDRIGEWQLVIYAISASVLLAALCWMFGGRHEFRATLRSSESE